VVTGHFYHRFFLATIATSQKIELFPNLLNQLYLHQLKLKIMDTSELKLKIFREVDSLEKSKLEELYGVLVNFLNSKNKPDDWDLLPEEQKSGIHEAIAEIEEGEGIPHESVVAEFTAKYAR